MHNTFDAEPVPAELVPVLAAAAAPPSAAEVAGERAAVAAFSSATAAPAVGRSRRVLASRAAVAAIAVFGLAGASAAAAATGTLPDAAQDAAQKTLTKVGVEVPKGKGKGLATAPGQQKKVSGTSATDHLPEKAKASSKPDTNKGATISSIAKDPTLTGAEKGAAVSDAASGGKSHAGEEHPTSSSSSVPPGPPADSPGVTAPGRTTASTAGSKAPTSP